MFNFFNPLIEDKNEQNTNFLILNNRPQLRSFQIQRPSMIYVKHVY